MSLSTAPKKQTKTPTEILNNIIESYQRLLISDYSNIENTLLDVVKFLSNTEYTSDEIVNEAKDKLSWVCQTWQDKLFEHKLAIRTSQEYVSIWRRASKLTKDADKLNQDFLDSYKKGVEAAFDACPSHPSLIISMPKLVFTPPTKQGFEVFPADQKFMFPRFNLSTSLQKSKGFLSSSESGYISGPGAIDLSDSEYDSVWTPNIGRKNYLANF